MSDERPKSRRDRGTRRRRERQTAAGPAGRRRTSSRVEPIEPPSPTRRTLWGLAIAIAAITVVLYLPVRHYPFIGFDDPGYVTENPRVTGGLSLAAVRWAMTSGYFANWHPLTWISHMTDVQLFGMNAGAHHVTNLIFHVADTLLLFGVLFQMTGAAGRSAAVAALFAVHPTHVESVAWVSERKDVLSTLFWMLTLWAYWAYTLAPSVSRYALVVVSLALGLMSKPMLVTLPCALLLLDVWPLRRAVPGESTRAVWLRLIYEKVPLLALAAASSLVTFVVQRNSGAVESLTKLSVPVRVGNAILAYWNYIEKLVWPSGLALLYPYPKSIFVGTVLLVLAALTVVTIVVARTVRTRPYLLIGWLWFIGTLVPVIGIVQVGKQPMADRYTYVPSIGLFIMAAWGLTELLRRIHASRGLAPALAVGTIAAYAVVARAQIEYWQSGIELWEHTIGVTGDNYLAENNLGWDLARANRPAEAIPHYEASIRLSPKFVGAHTNLALALVAVGQYEDAVAQYREALTLEPKNYLVHGHLAFALSHLGRLDEAVSEFNTAIGLKSDYVEALNGLGLVLARKADTDGAIQEYSEALRYMPKFAEAHNNLGAALASQGKLDEAVYQFGEAIRLKPVFADAHNNFAVALSTQGKLDSAVAQFRAAIRDDSNHTKAHYGLGVALERQGRPADAMREFMIVLRLQPNDAAAQQALEGLRQQPR